MKQAIALVAFMLTMLVWTAAQQTDKSSGPTSPNSQTPGASQSQPQPSAPGGQTPPQTRNPGDNSPAANQPITEGCLGGTSPNYTLTDKSGTTYKLSFPSEANVSTLEPHVGESVRVMGTVNASSIAVTRIGKGTGTCPAKNPKS
jgi:hypothetical protein